MAGQLTGCANKNAKELSNKVKNGEEIVIEAEAKEFDVQSEPCEIDWVELEKKNSNHNTREIVDWIVYNKLDRKDLAMV